MSASLQNEATRKPEVSPALMARPGLVLRKCACGGAAGMSGDCSECNDKRLSLQRKVSRPGDELELEADRMSEQVTRSLKAPALADGGSQTVPENSLVQRNKLDRDVVSRQVSTSKRSDPVASPEGAATSKSPTSTGGAPAQQTPGSPGSAPTQQAPGSPEGAPTQQTPGSLDAVSTPQRAANGLIVEDDARNVASAQMRKTQFLDELKAGVCAAADAELAAVGRSAKGCPYIESWINHYRSKDSSYIERALHKYSPEAAGITSARDYIPSVSNRIRRSVSVWAKTGRITGVPDELAGQVPGGGLGAVGEAISRVGSAISGIGGGASSARAGVSKAVSSVGKVFFKSREGGAKETDPEQIRSKLGPGRALDSGVKSRMESAFGHNFSHVRVHNDTGAGELSASMNARAFTLGEHVAFGAGEYKPGTITGDAIIAHELAHVVQQRGALATGPLSSGDANNSALEEDADEAAKGVLTSLWGRTSAGMTNLSSKVMPRLTSGMTLRRCNKSNKKCRLKTGPTYSPSGTITATASGGGKTAAFDMAAEFEHDPAHGFDASCCEARQFILWTVGPEPQTGAFVPASDFSPNTTYEDRDPAGKRYGHRTGSYAECVRVNHYENGAGAYDCASGVKYVGHDAPIGGATRTGQWQFTLKVVDTCDGERDVGTAASVIVQW